MKNIMQRLNTLLLIAIMIMAAILASCGGGGGSSGGSSGDAVTEPDDSDLKDVSEAHVTIANAFDITSANTESYFIVGTCSENDQSIDGSIGDIEFTATCAGNAWITTNKDVSSLPDSEELMIKADHSDYSGTSTAMAQTTVLKNTSTPVVSILPASPITNANVTDYLVEGTCSENNQIVTVSIDALILTPNCASGYWSTGHIDVSGIPDSVSVNITANHQNSLDEFAIPAVTTVVKDLNLPTVSIGAAPDINISNQFSYTVSGACSETDETVDIDIGSINHIETCRAGTWMVTSIDVSLLEDEKEIAVSARHGDVSGDAGAFAVSYISKETLTPTVSDLSLVQTLDDKAELVWSLEDPGGYTINDYLINYRIKGTGVWLLFNDGLSTTATTWITGLIQATSYEFRVALVYDASKLSAWSNVVQAETKPNNPIFSEHTAMNVGGADSSSVVAFEDNTRITLNGADLVTLNKGETYVFASTQYDIIDADKPIFTSGRLGPDNAGRRAANMVWIPASWASRSFSFNATRYNAQRLEIFPIESGIITVKSGNTVLATTALTEGVGDFLEWNRYGSYQVSSTGMVLLYHYSSGSGSYVDPKPLLPSSKKIIGFPSRSMRLTSFFDGTNYTAIHSNDVSDSSSLNKADSIRINPEGASAVLYKSDSLLITADKKISGASYADLNGYSASVFLPVSKMKKTYALNADADYVAFAGTKPGVIKILDASDDVITIGTLNKSGSLPGSPYKARFENLPAGTRMYSTVPMAGWYQPSGYVASMRNDETVLYGTNLEDPTSGFTPPSNPITCLTLKLEDPSVTDGMYEIDPDGDEGEASYHAYCDMTTQGGGWTLVVRYDRDLATSTDFSLPFGAGRAIINPDDMTTIEATTNLAASLDIRPFIKSGATHFMHVTTASNDSNYTYTYFNDINLFVRMFPDAVFDPSMDSNAGEGVQGSAVSWSETDLNRWYEDDFSIMVNSQTTGSARKSHQSINGGEGRAMFTNGDREGAVYSSGVATSGSVEGHSNPKVQWGFKGKDGTTQTYGGKTHVGTYCNASLAACTPAARMNFMFVR